MVLPIRLIRKDREVINLDCTDYMMNVTRAIYVQPIPFTGERIGGDLNMNTAAIRFECIIKDDEDCGKQVTSTNKKASAIIDFSAGAQAGLQTGITFGVYMSGDSVDGEDGSTSPSDLNGASFTITSTDATEFIVELNSTSTSTSAPSSGNTIPVGIQNADDAETIVSRIYDTLNGYSVFTDKITVAKIIGVNPFTDSGVLGALEFTQVTAGPNGHTGTPIFTPAANSTVSQPSISSFSGGRDGSCFSAGDKVQNLLGNVVSNTVLGAMGGMYNLADLGIAEGDLTTKHGQDYIIGVQIPYNSLVNSDTQTAVNGVPEGYAARNFIFGTGFGNKDKDAASNVELASTDFEISDRRTGIRGTVVQCEINYDAGDTIYRATITFQPLDVMAGI
tara:strand:+ start:2290 stop:3462 length:1173 start_codon:yes stop_codon:yes gene_type:complete